MDHFRCACVRVCVREEESRERDRQRESRETESIERESGETESLERETHTESLERGRGSIIFEVFSLYRYLCDVEMHF